MALSSLSSAEALLLDLDATILDDRSGSTDGLGRPGQLDRRVSRADLNPERAANQTEMSVR